MASSPITSWQIDEETMETVTDYTFLHSKITADGDCSHKIKSHLFLGRKTIINLDGVLKSRDLALSTVVSLVRVMVSPLVMYRFVRVGAQRKLRAEELILLNCGAVEALENPLGCVEIK